MTLSGTREACPGLERPVSLGAAVYTGFSRVALTWSRALAVGDGARLLN